MTDQIAELFAKMRAKQDAEDAKLQQIADSIGHNGGPPLVEPFGLRAAWCRFANELELRRLAVLHVRIERRKRGLADLTRERKTIMMRCIRRMRRDQGKE